MDARNLVGAREAHSRMRRRARAGVGVLAIAVVGVVAAPAPAGATSIFQIEFRHCDTLHVGYKHFPFGTVVRWSVSQHARGVGAGRFVTAPGPGMHFYSVKLPTPLDPHPKASVTFVAAVNGKEFRMTAGRAPVNPNKPLCPTARVTPAGGASPTHLTTAKSPSTTPPAPRVLAFTGNSPGALVGVGFVLAGAALLLVAQPTARRACPRHRRRTAPWLYITAARHTPTSPARSARPEISPLVWSWGTSRAAGSK
jgi:hypothetical protein